MAALKEKLAVLPDQPGCYLMKDKNDTIIYVGKAKNLKNRVRSYFTGSHDGKTQRLVSEIIDFEYIVTSSNIEALLLEMNLIKKHDPRYNVMLKDDKSYPYIKITGERHPRLITTRNIKKDNGKYFGPYPNVLAANETKKLLDRIYPLRKCNMIQKNRPCLYYQIGQCIGPCVRDVSEEEYQEMIDKITHFLRGGHDKVKKVLKEKMEQASEKLEFEKAMEYRDQIKHIETVIEKQKMMDMDFVDRDIFAFTFDKGWMCVQVFFVRQGNLIERDVSIFPFYSDPNDEFHSFIGQFYLQKNHIIPKEIYIPQDADKDLIEELLQAKVIQPQKGKKKDLVELAKKNAEIALSEKFKLIERDENRTIKAVENLGKHLNIATPHRIEAFDNSNIQGTNPVSAMVVFTDGKMNKKEYRKFNIKTVEGPDDYASMREVTRRRYSRLLQEDGPLPDLILIDGGKGQISAAIDVLENELGLAIPVCGLVKDEKHRTSHLILGEPVVEIHLPRNSQEFYLLQRIQDEVHRFAITFHRQKRDKKMFQSSIENIPGVGEKRRKALLRHFGSVKNIKEATVNELKEAGLPQRIAETVNSYYKENS